jgi:hypothetical protein
MRRHVHSYSAELLRRSGHRLYTFEVLKVELRCLMRRTDSQNGTVIAQTAIARARAAAVSFTVYSALTISHSVHREWPIVSAWKELQ